MKGLIYLSDGYEDFQEEKPPYETIFALPPVAIFDGFIPDWVTIVDLEGQVGDNF